MKASSLGRREMRGHTHDIVGRAAASSVIVSFPQEFLANAMLPIDLTKDCLGAGVAPRIHSAHYALSSLNMQKA